MRFKIAKSGMLKGARNMQKSRIGFAILVSSIWLLLLGAAVLQGMDARMYDLYFRASGGRPISGDIVVVGIDDISLTELGRWPWPRNIHGELIQSLNEMGAAWIGIDILFAEEHDSDGLFLEAMTQGGNVVLATKFEAVLEQSKRMVYHVRPTSLLREGSKTDGFINLPSDTDAFVRRFHTTALHHDQQVLSLAAALAKLNGAALPGPEKALRDGSYLINYGGGPRSFPTYSYYQIVHKMIPEEWIKDRIVLVGATAPDLRDTFATPFFNAGLTPGVEIHANVLATILEEAYILPVSPLLVGGLTVSSGLLAGVVIGGLSPLVAGFILLISVIGLVGGSYTLFSLGLWLPIVAPLGAMLSVVVISAIMQYVTEEREKRRIRAIFGRFVSEDVVKGILETQGDLALGGQRRTLTILFADIRGFTPLSEILPPEEVVGLLNEYFGAMTTIIFNNGGTVDKFMGDCIMALFGAPLDLPDHANQAVKAAVEMRNELMELQKKWSALGQVSLQAGIGINTGEVVVGNLGSSERMEYTAIGDAVNLAARFESLTRQYPCEILIGEETYRFVAEQSETIEFSGVEVKGKSKPMTVYGVTSWRSR